MLFVRLLPPLLLPPPPLILLAAALQLLLLAARATAVAAAASVTWRVVTAGPSVAAGACSRSLTVSGGYPITIPAVPAGCGQAVRARELTQLRRPNCTA